MSIHLADNWNKYQKSKKGESLNNKLKEETMSDKEKKERIYTEEQQARFQKYFSASRYSSVKKCLIVMFNDMLDLEEKYEGADPTEGSEAAIQIGELEEKVEAQKKEITALKGQVTKLKKAQE